LSAPRAVPLLGIAVAHILLQIKIPDMTRDVAAIGGIPSLWRLKDWAYFVEDGVKW
jgi:hypothetical protein